MAAGIKKLVIGGDYTAEQAVGYLADPQARGDYYTEGGSALMFWLASDRAKTYFALGDEVSRVKLTALLNGQHPVDGELIRRYGPNGTMVGAIDLTVSPAPKSVSALWALADNELRRELEEDVVLSVDSAVSRMLQHVPLVRERYGPGPRDIRHVKAGDWVGVQVLHTTARLSEHKEIPDPQLHVHNVLVGALDYAGRLRALDSRQILLFRSELDAQASSDLAERLRQRGFAIQRKFVRGPSGAIKRVAWEIEGVPADLVQAMSCRRGEVEDLRQRYREATGREADGAGWERFLEEHRGPKRTRSPEEMRTAWEVEGESYGFGPAQAAALRAEADARRSVGLEKRNALGPEAEQLRAEILADLCREHAFVPERELDKLVMQRSIGLMDPYEAMRVVAKMFGEGDLLATADGQVTTLEVLAAEQRATNATTRLLEAPPEPPIDRSELDEEFRRAEEDGRPFDDWQRGAVELATSGARFVSISGPAGTGKGYASRAMVAAWRRQSRRVIALAVAGRTAQQALADSGADEAYTLDGLEARLEHEILQLGPRDVLLVDEAGMIDHRRYAALLQAAAAAETTVVQIGDDRQLAAVGPGGLWTLTHRMAEASDQAAELRVIRRARNPREAQAWMDIRAGRTEEALSWYREQGCLRLYDTRPELLTGLVAAWWASEGRSIIVVDSTNEERDQLNRMAQAKRLEAGHVGVDSLLLANGREIRSGDRVLFNAIYKPEPAIGDRLTRRVENGTSGTVLAVDLAAKTGEIELEEPRGRRRLTLSTAAPLELGYVRHIAKGQGMTVGVADVAVSLTTDHNQLYTMITRSRESSRIHALRAELYEEATSEPAVMEADSQSVRDEAPTVEDFIQGTTLLSELQGIQRAREAEAVTIREIARRAERSGTKEAIGLRSFVVSERKEASRAALSEQCEAEREQGISRRTRDLSRLNSPLSRLRPPDRATQISDPMPDPMPAREAMESMARAHAQDRDVPKVLAYYEVAGRLDVVPDPAEHAVWRWLTDREAAIVVQDQEQEERVRLVARQLAAGGPEPLTGEPSVVQARAGYDERQARRREWRQAAKLTRGDLVEPDVSQRAYVVTTDHERHEDLVRGLSVAAESHLVTTAPNAWVAAHANAEAARLRESIAAKSRADQVRRAAASAELDGAQLRDAQKAERAQAHPAEPAVITR